MTTATTNRPIRLADMGRHEAEEVTKAIKDNFDSLGEMLAQARDRKAYKALGYRSFESYCKTEFGKSISSAYQLIEDAKLLSQLEERIAQTYGEPVTLKIPASHLRPLKNIDSTDDKLKAIEYAQKLATGEGKKPTKQHLEIAVFEISGKRSEDFKSAIQSLGFTKGVQVEVKKTLLKNDRGFVTNVDKLGKVHVELYYGGHKSAPYDATDLRILGESEKPVNPASEDTLNKGDKVKVFSKGLEGKTGEVYIWKPGKLVSVVVEDTTLPIDIAYAELEVIQTSKKDSNWESELIWESGKNTYYYFPAENNIYSNQWPTGLALKPYTHSGSPPEFMENWENRFSHRVLESLTTPDRLKNLVIKQVCELSVNEGREFAADLIDCLQEFIPQNDTAKKTALQQENQLLREQLAEAEAAIEAMVSASTNLSAPHPEKIEFLAENTEISAPQYATHADDWKSILIANNFTRNYDYTDDYTEEYRVWKIYLDPNGPYVELNHPEKGAFCGDTNFLSLSLEDEEKIIEWAKEIINQVEDFCPGQLSLFPSAPNNNSTICEAEAGAAIQVIENTAGISIPGETTTHTTDFLSENNSILFQKRERILRILEQEKQNLSKTNNEKTRKKIKINIRYAEEQLNDLDRCTQFKVGDIITKTMFPDKKGMLTKIEISPTGMPLAWVQWGDEYEEPSTPEQHPLRVLKNLSIEKEK